MAAHRPGRGHRLALLAIGAVVSHVRASDSVADTAPAVIGIGLAVATAVLQST